MVTLVGELAQKRLSRTIVYVENEKASSDMPLVVGLLVGSHGHFVRRRRNRLDRILFGAAERFYMPCLE